jgi:hypothetical protein
MNTAPIPDTLIRRVQANLADLGESAKAVADAKARCAELSAEIGRISPADLGGDTGEALADLQSSLITAEKQLKQAEEIHHKNSLQSIMQVIEARALHYRKAADSLIEQYRYLLVASEFLRANGAAEFALMPLNIPNPPNHSDNPFYYVSDGDKGLSSLRQEFIACSNEIGATLTLINPER